MEHGIGIAGCGDSYTFMYTWHYSSCKMLYTISEWQNSMYALHAHVAAISTSATLLTPSLSPISVPLEPEPQLHDIVVELALEAMLPWILPLPVDNLEGNVLQDKSNQEVRELVIRMPHIYVKKIWRHTHTSKDYGYLPCVTTERTIHPFLCHYAS